MGTSSTRSSDEPLSTSWGEGPIDAAQAQQFAQSVTGDIGDQETIARNLLTFPPQIHVRGIFFEGLARILASAGDATAMAETLERAGVTVKTTAFRVYPHRDFYKLYYLAARLLYPGEAMPQSLRLVAATFFPIFKNSLLGRTMSALMGDRPATVLPMLAKAYNMSVAGNDHRVELDGDDALVWSCEVEPVEWYPDTFVGIIEGTMPARYTARVTTEERVLMPSAAHYRFRISW